MLGAIIVVALLVVLGVFIASFFLRRYRESDRPQADWQPTAEVFNDPSTNRQTRVWVDAAGQRHYVAEGERPTA